MLFDEEEQKRQTLETGLAQFTQIYMPARNYAARTREEYRADLEDLADYPNDRNNFTWQVVGLRDLQVIEP